MDKGQPNCFPNRLKKVTYSIGVSRYLLYSLIVNNKTSHKQSSLLRMTDAEIKGQGHWVIWFESLRNDFPVVILILFEL